MSREERLRAAIEKSWGVGVIGRKEVKGGIPIDYFFPIGVRNSF